MIDWDRVKDLKSEIGEDSFDEIIELFLEETDEVVARLTKENGASALEADLHFLKGSALNIGFSEFARLCQEGERSASMGELSLDLSRVRLSIQHLRSSLMPILGKHPRLRSKTLIRCRRWLCRDIEKPRLQALTKTT
jgi:HPt (histidine-containing phosphotransfer) domain-containing protein